MPTYCTLYLVRHGQTDWNAQNLIQGHSDIPLNETGEQQAHDVSKTLAHIQFEAAVTSDLSRAKRTIEIVSLEHKLAVTATALLRERSFGKLEAKNQEVFRKMLAEYEGMTDKEAHSHRPANGEVESYEQVVGRVFTYLREISLAYLGKNVLVGSHGGVIRSILSHLGYLSYSELKKRAIKNTGYIVLLSDGVDFFVKEVVGLEEKK